jgi:hypothetical protein
MRWPAAFWRALHRSRGKQRTVALTKLIGDGAMSRRRRARIGQMIEIQRYVAVTHSGVTLSPLIGRLVAEELIGDSPSDLLKEFRPG